MWVNLASVDNNTSLSYEINETTLNQFRTIATKAEHLARTSNDMLVTRIDGYHINISKNDSFSGFPIKKLTPSPPKGITISKGLFVMAWVIDSEARFVLLAKSNGVGLIHSLTFRLKNVEELYIKSLKKETIGETNTIPF